MTQTVAVTKAITSLVDVQTKLGLYRTEQEDFFLEWQKELPPLKG